MDIKYRVIATFELLFVRAEEIEGDKDRVRLLFAAPVRIGAGDNSRNLSAKDCAAFLGGIWRSKVFRKTGVSWKNQGLSLEPGNYYKVEAAIDNFSLLDDKGRRSRDGLWFEILGLPISLQQPEVSKAPSDFDSFNLEADKEEDVA